MNTTSIKRRQVIESLADKEYRDAFVSSSIDLGLAFQIRALREARDWSQSELGECARMKQERISQLEDRDYGRPTLSTLKRLASAFDTALIVRFARFSELADWMANLTPERLAPPSFEKEHILEQQPIYTASGTHGATLGGITIQEAKNDWEQPSSSADASHSMIEPHVEQEKPKVALAA